MSSSGEPLDARIATGLFGAGVFARFHASKIALDPRMHLVGVYDPDQERAAPLAERYGARAFDTASSLIQSCAAVVIASPASTHAQLVAQAIEAGCDVLVEKPLALDPGAANALVQAAEQSGRILQVGHQERFVFEAVGLWSVPERPLLIQSVREGPFSGRASDVSVTYDLMIHDLDLALSLFGGEAASVRAHAQKTQTDHFDLVDADIEFPGGGKARFRASRMADAKKRTMEVVYPSGRVAIDFLSRTFLNETPFALDPDFAAKAPDPLGAADAAFFHSVATRKPSPIPALAAARAVALAYAIDRSALAPAK